MCATGHPRAQTGFSLTELMISLVLGLFLILGVTQVYLGSKRSFRTQEGMSRLQENGRAGIYFLQRTLRLAGFYSEPSINPATLFTAAAPAIEGTEGAAGAADSVTVRFQGAAGTTNCLGDAIAVHGMVTNIFSLTVADPATGLRSLQCNTGATTQPLLEGVSDFQITYGLDTTPADAVSTVNQYVSASAVGARWAHVKSLRIALTVNSVTPIDSGRGLRTQPFVTTITLRNRL